jgi:hypothetical protein
MGTPVLAAATCNKGYLHAPHKNKILPSARQRLRHSLADDVGPEVVSLGCEKYLSSPVGGKGYVLQDRYRLIVSSSCICEVQIADESRRMSSNIQGSESSHPQAG